MVQPVVVVPPRQVRAGARSRARPADSAERGQTIAQNPAFSLLNNTVRTYRDSTRIIELIRHMSHAEGQFSTAVHQMVEAAATGVKLLAYNASDHSFSPEGTLAAMSIAAGMDTPLDYTKAAAKRTLAETEKSLLREAILTGAVCSELVLNKGLVADRLQIVGVETLTWEEDGQGGFYPTQEQAGSNDPVNLNIPSFFYSFLSPDPNTVNPRSMVEAAVKMVVYFEEFMEDIRRSVRVAGHNRMSVVLDTARIKETAPKDVANDPKKLAVYMDQVRVEVDRIIGGLTPEQALVMYDTANADVLQSGTGNKIDYTPLLNVIAGQYATSLKAFPAVLGLRLEGGSSQMGSVETMMFVKAAKSLQTPVETILSRSLTLACRLLGLDVYVWARMNPIDLRPEHEVEAFLTMRESRMLDKLSLGLISDDEAAVEMGCFPRPPGAPDLSGTMFRHKNPVETNPGDTPLGRAIQPDKDAPRKAGGRSQ